MAADNFEQPIDNKSLIFLFLFGFIFRLIYVIQSMDNPLFGVALVDAESYQLWAERIVDGIWQWDVVDNYLPIYPAFLALQQMVFGPNPMVIKILQSLMGSLSAVLFAQAAARAWNRRVGLICGYLLATNWMLVVFESEKFAEPFSIFFLGLTLWLLINFSDRSLTILAAGFALALSAGVRANLFVLLPFICGWLIWNNRHVKRIAVKSALLFSLGTVVIIGPIVYRNYQLSGAPMLRAQASWSLYSGLSPEFEGLHPPVGILFQKYMHLPQQAGMRSEAEVEHFWAQKLWDIVRGNPLGTGLNLLRRLIIFLNAREWSQEFDVYAYRHYSNFLALPWTGFWLIGPFGLLGLLLTRRPNKNQWLLIICTIVAIASILPFKVSDRYRLPSAVLLTPLAALALWHVYQGIKTGNKKALLAQLPVLAVSCLICWPDWLNLTERKTARHAFFIGKHYEAVGRTEDALRAYERSMQEFSWDPDSPFRIGRILYLKGERDRAMEYLNTALQKEPKFPDAMNQIARIQLDAGNLAAAEKNLAASLKLAPAKVETLLLMADLQRRKGDTAGELAILKRAVVNTESHRAALALADRLIESGIVEDAIALYDHVMRSRQVDKSIRVTAAMLAGLSSIRFLKDTGKAKIYWQYIENEFSEFKFFSLQADFLAGTISEKTFRNRMGPAPQWKTAAEYIIGLKQWSEGNIVDAVEAFQRCLKVGSDRTSRSACMPQKWAREDLQRIQNGRLQGNLRGDDAWFNPGRRADAPNP